MEFPGAFWEERLNRPVDIYPEHKAEGPPWLPQTAEGRYRIQAVFLHVDTDAGVSGLAGPTTPEVGYIVERQLKPLLLGQDPLAIELIWDQLYRFAVHGRKGPTMMAMSVVDCALWDLKGRWAGVPLYRLLGGPTRQRIPAYASALGYSLEPALVQERAHEFVEQGYRATKWFFRHGPLDGPEGVARNVELVRTLRDSVGPDVDIMLDCWMSWDVPYAIKLAERLVEYRPRWLEEPVLPDKIESCAAIRRAIGGRIQVATGEHEYTRWGHKALMDAGAADVLQPDIFWCGGISETLKICALASAYDLVVIPHGHSVPATAHLVAAQPPSLCPLLEYLLKWNEIHQFFFREPLRPTGGSVMPPDRPGMGMELDEAKIETQRLVQFSD
jgi:L-alanine-DL-glutamate epimerase-like enolase superfamily enzyme